MSELDQLRQEAEQLKNQIRVSLLQSSSPWFLLINALSVQLFYIEPLEGTTILADVPKA